MKFGNRRPNWLHCRRCCAFGCDGHLLLDPLHFYVIHQHFLVHLPFWQLRASCEVNCQGDKQSGCRGWERCCSPRSCPSWWRPRKYQVILILSVCLFKFAAFFVASLRKVCDPQKIWLSFSFFAILILEFKFFRFFTLIKSTRHHKYYQWVCFTLYFQAILFYIPRSLLICITHTSTSTSSSNKKMTVHAIPDTFGRFLRRESWRCWSQVRFITNDDNDNDYDSGSILMMTVDVSHGDDDNL